MKRLFTLVILASTLTVANAQVKVSVGEFNYSFEGEFLCDYAEENDSTFCYIHIDQDSLIYFTFTINKFSKTYQTLWRYAVARKDVDLHLSWVNAKSDSELYFVDIIAILPGYKVHTSFCNLGSGHSHNKHPVWRQMDSCTIRISCKKRGQAYDLFEKLQ